MAEIGPKDVDVVQIYEHFSGAVPISLVEHGFCEPDGVMELCRLENFIAPHGKLPLNTSGGNIAECYMPEGLPAPKAQRDGMDAGFWEALRRHELVVQRCKRCKTFQFGPEWICY